MKEDSISQLAVGASISFAGRFIGRGLQILSQIFLARLLGPAQFGMYAIGWTLLRLGSVLAPLGLNNGVIRFATQYWPDHLKKFDAVLQKSLFFTFLSGCIFGSAFYFSAPWLAIKIFKNIELIPILRWFAVSLPLATILRWGASTTQITKRMSYSVYAEDLSQPISNFVLIVIFYFLGWGVIGAASASFFSFAFALAIISIYLHRLFPTSFNITSNKDSQSSKELILFSLPTALTGFFTVALPWMDRLFIGYYRPETEVGIYQALSQTSILFAIIVNSFNAIFSPMIADLFYKRQSAQLEELFKVSTKWGIYVSIPAFLIVCFAPQELLTFVFGQEYSEGSFSLIILTVAQMINVATGAVSFLLIMTGRQNLWLVISGSTLAVNILLNYLLIPSLGQLGAAIATATSITMLFSFGLFQVKRKMNFWPYDRRYFKGITATLITTIFLTIINGLKLNSPSLYLFWTITISIFAFPILLTTFGLDSEDRQFINLVKHRILKSIINRPNG
ncbi:flippase [Candidatus Leptofilum sp.]|uniref:flippase n=1 Tax=Candidatus Leptofilum sp. TaxID=3241576 RepID=UPI003B5AA210